MKTVYFRHGRLLANRALMYGRARPGKSWRPAVAEKRMGRHSNGNLPKQAIVVLQIAVILL
jgi:hypothetical protein